MYGGNRLACVYCGRSLFRHKPPTEVERVLDLYDGDPLIGITIGIPS